MPSAGRWVASLVMRPAEHAAALGKVIDLAEGSPIVSHRRPRQQRRRRPQPVEGTEFIIDCDRVLLAIGQGPELAWLEDGAEGIEKTKRWRLDADAVTFSTGRAGVFGAGDVPQRSLNLLANLIGKPGKMVDKQNQ